MPHNRSETACSGRFTALCVFEAPQKPMKATMPIAMRTTAVIVVA